MRQMVRSIVGTMIDVGRGKIDANEFERIVLARDRTQAGRTAPAHGLYLVAVRYDDPENSAGDASTAPDFLPSYIDIAAKEKL